MVGKVKLRNVGGYQPPPSPALPETAERMICDEDCLPKFFKDEPAASPVAGVSALELLADVMHLWVDGYISKSPRSCADDSVSGGVFEKVASFLEAQEVEVDYCGWRRVAQPSAEGDGWIAVSERLPEVAKADSCCIPEDEAPIISEPVLVWDEDDCERIIAELEIVDGSAAGAVWRSRETGKELHGVTMWQPIPAEPLPIPAPVAKEGRES